MRLVVDLGGNEIEFTEPLSGGAFPYLLEVGTLRIAARAGYISGLGVGESPSLAVTLNNAGDRAADIIGAPLRSVATIYDDDGSVYWSGIVSAASYGRTLGITIDA
jgi:hypothetical protein